MQSDCPTNHRHRKSWAESTEAERDLYATGFKALADQGVVQIFTRTHMETSEHSNSQFLPWHRHFVYLMENAIRNLGGEYSCFVIPYWDWTSEPTPSDVAGGSSGPFIMESGLGGDGDGDCLNDPVWGDDGYDVYTTSDRLTPGNCLIRDLDYADEPYSCLFYSPSQIMDVIDSRDEYEDFRPTLEGTPHAMPHVCIGGDDGGDMSSYFSPNDPIFYLHHAFVDMVYAVWQDCHDYDERAWSDCASSNMQDRGGRCYMYDRYPTDDYLYYDRLQGVISADRRVRVSSTLDIVGDYDVSYSKGQFWIDAEIDQDCDGEINTQWFYDEPTSSALEAEYRNQYRPQRSSLSVSQQIWRNLREKYPTAPTKALVAEWAEESCIFEQRVSGNYCPMPEEMPDCDSFPVDPETGDIVISLEEMINIYADDPDKALTECQKGIRRSLYSWAELMHQKKSLCDGCYDDAIICGVRGMLAEGKCTFNSNEHPFDDDGDDETVIDAVMAMLVTARDGAQENLATVVLLVAALLIVLAKCWLDGSRTKKDKIPAFEFFESDGMETTTTSGRGGYGAVY